MEFRGGEGDEARYSSHPSHLDLQKHYLLRNHLQCEQLLPVSIEYKILLFNFYPLVEEKILLTGEIWLLNKKKRVHS